ncbi:WXG100 family type VII secretion target [Streptomyces sp.]|uniref:WXG100 family type VII secretion target n=1 Tax=Streptomyces sp. TaxID=1931 RepID=UPI002F41EA83
MTRPAHGWEVLGEDGDPVPGDPEEVTRLGRELRRTAEAIEKEANEIRALASVESWKGKSADEFRDQAQKAEGKLRKALHRYEEAAAALGTDVVEGTYAGDLHRAQKLADKALRDAQDADTEHTVAQRALDRKPPETPDDDPHFASLTTRRDASADALNQARAALHTAKHIRDTAAQHAAHKIRHAIDHDGLKDSRWDKFKNWVHENAGWISKIADIAGIVATVCGILSLCVGWIPVIGPALAGILGTIALLAAVVSLAAHLVLALAGEGSWFDVVLDAVGLATFGIGRGAIGAARGASIGARGLARSAKFTKAMEQVAARGLKKGTKGYNTTVQKAWKAANRAAEDAPRGREAYKAVTEAPGSWFPGWARVREAANPVAIAKESWQTVKELKAFRDFPRLFEGSTWQGVRFRIGDPALSADIDKVATGLAPDIADLPAVKKVADIAKLHLKIWQGTTWSGIVVDLSDKAKAWDSLNVKDAAIREVGS